MNGCFCNGLLVNIIIFSACWRSFTSSHPTCSERKGAFRNFVKFTGKHQSLFFKKVAGCLWSCRPQPATLLKCRIWHRYFPVNFAKFLRAPFLQNTPGRLLLFIIWFSAKFTNHNFVIHTASEDSYNLNDVYVTFFHHIIHEKCQMKTSLGKRIWNKNYVQITLYVLQVEVKNKFYEKRKLPL